MNERVRNVRLAKGVKVSRRGLLFDLALTKRRIALHYSRLRWVRERSARGKRGGGDGRTCQSGSAERSKPPLSLFALDEVCPFGAKQGL